MARIRTIKPEFVESESIGRLSRDARLLFVLLWTFVDDEGRARASARLLSSRLYPYDDDAPKKMSAWLAELQAGNHVRLYEVDGNSYLDIPKWSAHQKIDHPAKSRIPEFCENLASPSEDFANTSETLAPHIMDHGPRTMDLGPRTGEGGGAVAPSPTAEAVDLFNHAAADHDWPQVQSMNPSRTRALTGCLKSIGGIEGWQTLLAKVMASDFLMGRTARADDHANWRFTFDFLLMPKRYTKIMEGGYDNRNGTHQPERGISAVLAALAD